MRLGSRKIHLRRNYKPSSVEIQGFGSSGGSACRSMSMEEGDVSNVCGCHRVDVDSAFTVSYTRRTTLASQATK